MPCPHHRSSDDEDHGLDRREFMKAALVIGGSSALTAVRARAHGDGGQDGDGHAEPAPGTDDPDALPHRQFAWNDFVPTSDATGESKTPKHHLQFMLSYVGDGTPSEADREQVETALRTLERAYEWSNEGMLFTIGYSPAYFDRFEEDLPADTGLGRPEEIVEETDVLRSGAVLTEQSDAHMHLASDTVLPLLEAEEALFGDVEEINGVEVDADFRGVFERVDRRTGFIGNPHEQWDEEIPGRNPVGEDAPVWFGFKSLFSDSQPTEDRVAITDEDHPFEGATTEQVSVLRDEGIRAWYRRFDHEERVERMFSPHHTSEDTGPHGRDLVPTSGTENRRDDGMTMDEIADLTAEDAATDRVVGHAQKMARARDPHPPLLRRDFPSTDGNRVHTQFISNQRTIDDFISVRKHMAFVDTDGDDRGRGGEHGRDDDRGRDGDRGRRGDRGRGGEHGRDDDRSRDGDRGRDGDHGRGEGHGHSSYGDDERGHPDEDAPPGDHVDLAFPERSAARELPPKDHGIQGHFRVERRGTFLVPSRDHRALPPASP